jgi:membrane-bound ClpP family serine protease
MSKDLKNKFFSSLTSYNTFEYKAYLNLTIVGLILFVIGFPMALYELAIGYSVKNEYIAFSICTTIKFFGVFINFIKKIKIKIICPFNI